MRQAIAAHRPAVLPVDRPHAAVALLLVDAAPAPEALFIVRAPHETDPWAGNIGFPGGRVAPDDGQPRQTAERETREELGLDLTGCSYLGRLDDLYGATLPILVSCFVYATATRPVPTPNHEVAGIFWYPLHELANPARHRLATFSWRGESTTQPVVELLDHGQPLLWGITYRLLRNFFGILELPFGPTVSENPCPPPNPR
ncbi:MAG: CoA pyrophosphatase [Desulfuromonas sp.]|nr:CoA pyrophosphatase [Desulfuromonas sp.]